MGDRLTDEMRGGDIQTLLDTIASADWYVCRISQLAHNVWEAKLMTPNLHWRLGAGPTLLSALESAWESHELEPVIDPIPNLDEQIPATEKLKLTDLIPSRLNLRRI